jgi:recombination protein RecR
MHWEKRPTGLLESLVEGLATLPSIGRKSAQRMAYHLLGLPVEQAESLGQLIIRARKGIHPCLRCGNHAEAELCSVCSLPSRNPGLICVVERPADVAALERLGFYGGVYHVLGGVLSPLDGMGPGQLNLVSLRDRCAKHESETGRDLEIVLALSTGAEGEATGSYIQQMLKGMPVRLSRLARGVPVGSELEYVDELTMQRAMEGRVVLP